MNRPTIADVARTAGVSVPTVSRALSGSAPVSSKTREQVMSAVRALNYRPNAAARALVTGHQRAIALIARNTYHYGYAMTIRGIEERARQSGYMVMIGVVETDGPEDVKKSVSLVLSQPVAGAIVLAFDRPGIAALQEIPLGLPLVTLGEIRNGGGLDNPFLAERDGAVAATEYLVGLGHQSVYHVAIPESGASRGRAEGWRAALTAASAAGAVIQAEGWSPRHGYQCGLSLVKLGATAVLCGNDDLAIGVMQAVRQSGKRVPDDISIVGFDDQPFAEFTSPALTTVNQDFVGLGRHAVDRLLHQLDQSQVEPAPVPVPQLVVRQSTAPPPDSSAAPVD